MQISFTILTAMALGIGFLRYSISSAMHTDLTGEQVLWFSKTNDSLSVSVTESSYSTGGASFSVELSIMPGTKGFYPGKYGSMPLHSHKTVTEMYRIVSGRGRVALDGREMEVTASSGELVIPPGVVHTIWNSDEEDPLVLSLMCSPPGPLGESFFLTQAGVSYDAGSLPEVNPLQIILLYKEAGVVLADLPPAVWKLVEPPLAWFARVVGYRHEYPQYTSRAA